jgi:hypothetical protein
MIINYWDFHITLNELARSVKPNGELLNTVAEVALYAINPTGRKAKKQVLPLRISVCMVFHNVFFVISFVTVCYKHLFTNCRVFCYQDSLTG